MVVPVWPLLVFETKSKLGPGGALPFINKFSFLKISPSISNAEIFDENVVIGCEVAAIPVAHQWDADKSLY